MILAKCKREYKILKLKKSDISQLYQSPITEQTQLIEFNTEAKCELDEWLFIDLLDHKEEIIDHFLNLFKSTANLNTFDDDSFSAIDFLITKPKESNELFLKKITKAKRIENISILQIKGRQLGSSALKVINIPNGIELDGNIDAYYDGNNRLYFKNFNKIHNIFKGIDIFYREANEEEVASFKNSACLELSDYTRDIGIRNLKMIAFIKDNPKIKLDQPEYIQQMIDQASNFDAITLRVENNKFIINNESDLSQFLKLALGRFYINPLTDDKMLANTAKTIF
ncbi:hypothetical protein [uncultured Veillonella sp.]|uniref:hypothetical protein n=1 Tax=uncultured Veillonella sp. TaxID=159268 RepID=UPI0026141204|nr:hypothetical protein [uncultured Veillonella sp.]